jgi:hypothetical protein
MSIQRITVATDQQRERVALSREHPGNDVLIVVDVVWWDFGFRRGHGARITPR